MITKITCEHDLDKEYCQICRLGSLPDTVAIVENSEKLLAFQYINQKLAELSEVDRFSVINATCALWNA